VREFFFSAGQQSARDLVSEVLFSVLTALGHPKGRRAVVAPV